MDHLHEHFADPVRVEGGRYRAPLRPGSGAEMLATTLKDFSYPDGPAWREQPARR